VENCVLHNVCLLGNDFDPNELDEIPSDTEFFFRTKWKRVQKLTSSDIAYLMSFQMKMFDSIMLIKQERIKEQVFYSVVRQRADP
jgi:hypothetical protein